MTAVRRRAEAFRQRAAIQSRLGLDALLWARVEVEPAPGRCEVYGVRHHRPVHLRLRESLETELRAAGVPVLGGGRAGR